MAQVLAKSSHLTGSEGSEYDLVIAEGDQSTLNAQGTQVLAAKLGLHPRLMGVETSDLFTPEDLTIHHQPQTSKLSIDETLAEPGGLSRREMNRARRKARQSMSKQRSREPDDQDQADSLRKKIKLEDPGELEGSLEGKESGVVSIGAVPDGTGCWPETAMDWPLEVFGESLSQDLFSQKWEIRHGAATALRELVRIHGKGAGKSREMSREEMEESHRRWVCIFNL